MSFRFPIELITAALDQGFICLRADVNDRMQITNIRVVKEAMQEAAYMFAELALMGASMAYLDVGGGLAIDYDGSKTDTVASLSYTMQQYANDVVATVQARRGAEVPPLGNLRSRIVMLESGRGETDQLVAPPLPNEVKLRLSGCLRSNNEAECRRSAPCGPFLCRPF